MQGRGQGNGGRRPYGPAPGAPAGSHGERYRPAYPGPASGRSPSLYPDLPPAPYNNPRFAPPGHLEDWLEEHRGLSLRGQEQLLRGDPSFKHLPAAKQQRLMRQLQEVYKMPPRQRALRLARAEAIENLSPQERRRLDVSGRNFAALPQPRQTLVKRAFQQLRSVPVDERQTVLDSARYRGLFSPEERHILTNFLSVEPYSPPR